MRKSRGFINDANHQKPQSSLVEKEKIRIKKIM